MKTHTSINSSRVLNWETITFWRSYTLVNEICNFPVTLICASSGSICAKKNHFPYQYLFCLVQSLLLIDDKLRRYVLIANHIGYHTQLSRLAVDFYSFDFVQWSDRVFKLFFSTTWLSRYRIKAELSMQYPKINTADKVDFAPYIFETVSLCRGKIILYCQLCHKSWMTNWNKV